MNICAIHQPQFLPWLGYLDKIRRADVFVFLDDVQFKKNEFQNRNRLLIFGQPRWITVPVSFAFGDSLRRVRVARAADWAGKLWRTLEHNYRRTPFFGQYAGGLRDILLRDWDNLAAINIAAVQWLLACFGITRDIRCSSEMPGLTVDPTQRLLDICARVDADTYLSGAGGRGYLDVGRFDEKGVRLVFQDYRCAAYPQLSNGAPQEFTPFLSAVDALFNVGGDAALRDGLFSGDEKALRAPHAGGKA